MTGWWFAREADQAFIAIEDFDKARVRAVQVLGGEPTKEPKKIPQDVLDFLEMIDGRVVTARALF